METLRYNGNCSGEWTLTCAISEKGREQYKGYEPHHK